MLIEHIAFNVPDPVAMADWYCLHLGMQVVRSFEAPNFGRFLADSRQGTTLEFYRNPQVAVPDYAAQDARVMHIAFEVIDLDATCSLRPASEYEAHFREGRGTDAEHVGFEHRIHEFEVARF